MKKYEKYKGLLIKKHGEKGWALVVGAGTSTPIFPSWNKLVVELIKKDTKTTNPEEVGKYILENYSPDTTIQAVQHRLNMNDGDFAELLRATMYQDLIDKLSTVEWRRLRLIIESVSPHSEKDPIWETYIDIRERIFKNTSAYGIGKVVIESIDKLIAPNAIITFNAESILFSIINSFEREKFIGKQKLKGQMSFPVRRITHSVFGSANSSIPYIHCHGLLTPPLVKKRSPFLQAHDKLVFSETAYLHLANSNFSWQSSVFLSNAISNKMVFIGVSLSDPNMRRWLSWIFETRVNECNANGMQIELAKGDLNTHYWINKSSGDKERDEWIESCVAHLGVKVVWIDYWEDVEAVLKIMLNL